ncbi:hypothetical protein [Streptomyces sp. MBT84]|uniref:hypothetical protein n=1 Tax=Streptomyces sp. MBT84 TaxID=1488414 RepID=UPI0020768745|nr:hypothetical protein [Streptomyces sp. MBT84]
MKRRNAVAMSRRIHAVRTSTKVSLEARQDSENSSYPFPWIEEVEDFSSDLEDQGDMEVSDGGEEHGDVYVAFLAGTGEGALLAVASRVATSPGVSAGANAVVSDDEAEEFGLGLRVVLPLPAS